MVHSALTETACIVFFISLGLLVYAYFGYLALIAIVAAFCRPRKVKSGYTPTLSVLIAAYNEQANIGRKLEQALAFDYPPDKLEIVVVSDGSTDRTEEIVRSFDDPRIHLIRVEDRKGKTNAQNVGVKSCHGEVIVFSDATTAYHPVALRFLATHYTDPKVGAVSGRYQYFDPSGHSATGLGSIAFWNYENLIKTFQSRIMTLTGCSGCIYSVRASAYTPLPVDALSDMVEPLCVLRQGYRVVFEPRALAYEETTLDTNHELRMRIRVISRGISSLLSMGELLWPHKYGWIAIQLISHKLLRWLAFVYLIGMFLSSALLLDVPFFRYAFLLQLAFYLFAVFSALVPLYRRWNVLGIPLYFCVVNLAAMMSWIGVMKGRKYVTWETVR
jgi:cellulose synthase/poly-beta-1,6-N-acetylglucosamine synthase-like glycosyltransferase